MEPIFFTDPSDFRKWLLINHDKEPELLVGYYKKATGLPSITWAESVDEALCFGWIDGIRRSIDEQRYCIRFTPRKPRSIWSAINIKRAQELQELGLMEPTGVEAFNKRSDDRSNLYSFEQKSIELTPDYEHTFRANERAWSFFLSQPPSYRKPAIWWVIRAKQERTRLKRLAILIHDSEKGQRIASLQRLSRAKTTTMS